MMVWYIPPFQKADEVTHFNSTATIIGGVSGKIQKRFSDLPEKLRVRDVAFKYDSKIDGRPVWEKNNDKSIQIYEYNINWKSYIIYFPVEIGVWLGSLTSYPVMALYLGRMAGLLLFLMCVWKALKIIPKKYKGLIVAYSLIPMVLHQVTEVSYDVFLLCLSPLILAIFLRTLKTNKFWKWLTILVVILFISNNVKQGYFVSYLLIIIVLWDKFKEKIILRPWLIPIAFAVLVPIVIVGIRRLDGFFGGSFGLVHGIYQYEIIKHDPIQIMRIIADTWEAKRDFYIKGMLGYFGWLDYELDLNQMLLIVMLVTGLVVNVIYKIKKPIIGWVGWILSGGIIFGTYLLIGMGFFSQWTVVGSTIIEGVQGRYLLPMVPLLFFWTTQFWLLVGKKRANVIVMGLVCLTLISGIIDKIYNRYYDLSSNFQNVNEFKNEVEKIKYENKEAVYVSSKNGIKRNFHTSDGDVLGGFEIYIKKKDKDVIRVPYRYSIKDKECSREIIWGYLNADKIKNNDIYIEKFASKKMMFNDICFSITPIITYQEEKYFDYAMMDDEPMMRLLYMSSEVR